MVKIQSGYLKVPAHYLVGAAKIKGDQIITYHVIQKKNFILKRWSEDIPDRYRKQMFKNPAIVYMFNEAGGIVVGIRLSKPLMWKMSVLEESAEVRQKMYPTPSSMASEIEMMRKRVVEWDFAISAMIDRSLGDAQADLESIKKKDLS